MEAKAVLKFSRISPQKARLVADQIRGRKVGDALNVLSFLDKKGAKIIRGVVKSAIANAEDKDVDDVDELAVKTIMIDGGPIMKRQLPRARGRATMIHKRTSHITVILG